MTEDSGAVSRVQLALALASADGIIDFVSSVQDLIAASSTNEDRVRVPICFCLLRTQCYRKKRKHGTAHIICE